MIKSLELDSITYRTCLELLEEYDKDTYEKVKNNNYTDMIIFLSNYKKVDVSARAVSDKISNIIKEHNLSNRQIRSLRFMLTKLLLH